MGKKYKFTQQISSAKGQTERPPKYILWCIPKGSKKAILWEKNIIHD